MKALICEMCGSNHMLKKNGFYVCESCGTKYTTEEAKKLLVEATVVIDESNRISNYLELARQALAAGNTASAENYANRTLEVDAKNYEAWLIKAKTASEQFALNTSSARECFQYYKKAYQLSNAKEIKDSIITSLQSICINAIAHKAYAYEKSASPKEAKELLTLGKAIQRQCDNFEDETGSTLLTAAVRKKIAGNISQATARAWNNIIAPEFRQDNANAQVFYNKGIHAVELLKFAIKLDKNGNKRNLTRYENLCDMADSLMSPVIPRKLKALIADERETWETEIKRLSEKTYPQDTYDETPNKTILIIGAIILILFLASLFTSCKH